jgi:hypothetical protein
MAAAFGAIKMYDGVVNAGTYCLWATLVGI